MTQSVLPASALHGNSGRLTERLWVGIWYVSYVSVLHLPDLLLRRTTWQPPLATLESVTISFCRSRRNVKSTRGTSCDFCSRRVRLFRWELHQTVQQCGHKVLTNVLFLLLQAQPVPTNRYCIPLLILAAVTLTLVITGIFSYRHLSALRVSTIIVFYRNSTQSATKVKV